VVRERGASWKALPLLAGVRTFLLSNVKKRNKKVRTPAGSGGAFQQKRNRVRLKTTD